MEFARNVLGLEDADHEEYKTPGSTCFVVSRLACSLVGQRERVTILPGTRAALLYGAEQAMEDYYCNYGINTQYQPLLETGGLVVSGVGTEGEARIVELSSHPFFLATLFLPQARPATERPHPLIIGYSAAVARARDDHTATR